MHKIIALIILLWVADADVPYKDITFNDQLRGPWLNSFNVTFKFAQIGKIVSISSDDICACNPENPSCNAQCSFMQKLYPISKEYMAHTGSLKGMAKFPSDVAPKSMKLFDITCFLSPDVDGINAVCLRILESANWDILRGKCDYTQGHPDFAFGPAWGFIMIPSFSIVYSTA